MKMGTKSLLFGVHQFFIHPLMVLWAWRIIYRKWPKPFQLCAIITHDWGYWGLSNMDGAEGETHAERSSDLWYRCKGSHKLFCFGLSVRYQIKGHSRFSAKKWNHGMLSELFQADKLSVALYPRWLYLLLGNLSGEIHEYMAIAKDKEGKYIDLAEGHVTQTQWLLEVQSHMIMMGLKGKDYEPVKKQMEFMKNRPCQYTYPAIQTS